MSATPENDLPPLPANTKTYAGIPEAVFVDDVDQFMTEKDNAGAEKVLRQLDEQHSKYKLMEYNISARRRKLKAQIPNLAKTLDMIDELKHQTDTKDTDLLLSEQVFIKAMVPPTKNVYLWLGANVMLEYPLEEAAVLLHDNMDSAVLNLKILEHDQDFLRDQLTTTEVNMARVYNWDVKRRQVLSVAATSAQWKSDMFISTLQTFQ